MLNLSFRIRVLFTMSLASIFSMPVFADEGTAPTPVSTVSAEAPKAKAPEPFAFADFTWLNGNSRQENPVFDTKYFTGEFFADVNYIYDFNHPIDHTLGGTTEGGRVQEVQLQHIGIGGDFHYDNVRGRFITQFGLNSTMTPRNDSSPSRGQWQLDNAYRYVSEAYGGYHFDVWNGVNVDAGLFMSYIGLFSYYNYENWVYQPSYVSSNTPWYFNGVRIQTFPSDRLKIEYWIINGWQSYGMFNEAPGLGMQFLWRPNGSVSVLSNNYWGHDTQDRPGRVRVHTDNSLQIKYYDHSEKPLSKAAFSLTVDAGCEQGGGVHCFSSDSSYPVQSFLGIMLYNRLWFAKNIYAVTIGGGAMTNPGRYLVLIPPIQGATAANNNCPYCLPTNPGTRFTAWDATLTFDYMPSQSITWRAEYNHRAADVPYFVGRGGITSPDGYNTTAVPATWRPDLVKTEDRINLAMLVRF